MEESHGCNLLRAATLPRFCATVPPVGQSRRDFIKKTVLASLCAGTVYPVFGEPWLVETVRIQMPVARLPGAFEGFRIVQLSDLHLHPFTTLWQISRVVSLVNDLRPDLVMITGDFITAGTVAIEPLAPELARLQAKYGVVSVLGNHDERSRPDQITGLLRKAGIEVFRNEGRDLTIGSSSIFLAGVNSIINGHPRLERALARRTTRQPTLLMAHEPDFIDLVPASAGIDVQLSGHSHGGQMCLPFLGPPVLPAWGQKYWRGQHRVGATTVYTNRGIGTIGLPIRLGSRPEITEIILVGGGGALEKSPS